MQFTDIDRNRKEEIEDAKVGRIESKVCVVFHHFFLNFLSFLFV